MVQEIPSWSSMFHTKIGWFLVVILLLGDIFFVSKQWPPFSRSQSIPWETQVTLDSIAAVYFPRLGSHQEGVKMGCKKRRSQFVGVLAVFLASVCLMFQKLLRKTWHPTLVEKWWGRFFLGYGKLDKLNTWRFGGISALFDQIQVVLVHFCEVSVILRHISRTFWAQVEAQCFGCFQGNQLSHTPWFEEGKGPLEIRERKDDASLFEFPFDILI